MNIAENLKDKFLRKLEHNPKMAKAICCWMMSHYFCNIYLCNTCRLRKYRKGW